MENFYYHVTVLKDIRQTETAVCKISTVGAYVDSSDCLSFYAADFCDKCDDASPSILLNEGFFVFQMCCCVHWLDVK